MKVSKFVSEKFPSLKGKTVAISGATGGIGKHLCRHLAILGASLILMDRNRKRSRQLGKSLRAEFPGISISYIKLDLERIDTVKKAAQTLLENVPDFLILNAGAYHIPRHVCSTGYENVFQINFVSPYFLARTLMPEIQKKGGKIVAVSSIAHDYSTIDENDIDFRTREKSSLVYGNAKRFLTYALVGNDGVNITHPGITFTNITAHYPKYVFAVIKHPMKVIFMRPEKAAISILTGLFSTTTPQNESWIGPRFWGIWGMPCRRPLYSALQEEKDKIRAIADNIFKEISENGETL